MAEDTFERHGPSIEQKDDDFIPVGMELRLKVE
jgi:hypothetical protein